MTATTTGQGGSMTREEAKRKMEAEGCRWHGTPWEIAAAERMAEDGPWSDFAAFEAWMSQRLDEPCGWDRPRRPTWWARLGRWWSKRGRCHCATCDAFAAWDNMDSPTRVMFYAAIMDVADAVKKDAEPRGE